MAQIVQADLSSVGMQLVVQHLNQPDFVSRLRKAQFGGAWIISMSWMNLSPATLFQTAFPVRVPNGSNFDSQQYRNLIDQTFAATDNQQLQVGLRELTQIILDEAFIVMIAEGTGQQGGPEVARADVKSVT